MRDAYNMNREQLSGKSGPRQVFISYKREDSNIARSLRQALKAEGVTVWWDEEIRTGDRWDELIDTVLSESDAVVVLWSTASVGSDWVRYEASIGKLQDKLAHARIDGAKVPAPFRSIHMEDLSGWNGQEDDARFQRLLQAIRAIRWRRLREKRFRHGRFWATVFLVILLSAWSGWMLRARFGQPGVSGQGKGGSSGDSIRLRNTEGKLAEAPTPAAPKRVPPGSSPVPKNPGVSGQVKGGSSGDSTTSRNTGGEFAKAPTPAVPKRDPLNTLSRGLIAYWSFDDGTASDISGHGHNGVISGSINIIEGAIGGALRFDGKCSIAVSGTDFGVTSASEKSIALWIRPLSISANNGIISKYRHSDSLRSNFYASIFLAGGQIWTRLTGNGTNVLDVKRGQIGTWQHLVFFMKEGPGNSQIFYDGTLAVFGNLAYNLTISEEPLRIGEIVGADDQAFRGDLDEIRIYDRQLSTNEIRQLATRTQKAP
jgi:TIR domain-containing protein/concanavalin A-like lectin/glucanase superfamily protein